VIRPAVPADAEALAALQLSCWHEAYGELAPPGTLDSDTLDRRRGALPAGAAVTAPEGVTAVGTARLANSSNEGAGLARRGRIAHA